MILPAELIRDDIPANYTVWSGTPAKDTNIILDMFVCPKLALDGVDQGPSTVTLLVVELDRPPETPDEMRARYVLQAYTNHPELSHWLEASGAGTSPGDVTHAYVQNPAPAAEVFANVTDSGEVVYATHGVSAGGMMPNEVLYRYFYGENPAEDFWDFHIHYNFEGDSPAEIVMSANSRLAQALGQTGPLPGGIREIADAVWTLSRPSKDSEKEKA